MMISTSASTATRQRAARDARNVYTMKNKKTHFVPAGFLKNFSQNPDAGRDAKLFVFDGEKSFENSVGNLCVEADFYGFDRKQEFAIHGEIESGLFDVVDKLRNGDREMKTYVSMLFHASYLQVRGPAFENESALERLYAAQKHGTTHFCEHLLRLDKASLVGVSGKELAKKAIDSAKSDWSFAVLRANDTCSDPELMCSDCPVLIFTNAGQPNLVVVPLEPCQLFVAAPKSDLQIVSVEYTEADAAWANAAQCYFSHRHLFSRRPLKIIERSSAAKLMAERPPVDSQFEEEDLIITTYSLGKELPSFLRSMTA